MVPGPRQTRVWGGFSLSLTRPRLIRAGFGLHEPAHGFVEKTGLKMEWLREAGSENPSQTVRSLT